MRGKYKYLISELGVLVFCYVPALIKITAVSSFKIRRLIDYVCALAFEKLVNIKVCNHISGVP